MRKPLSVTDELLARTWGTGSALNQFFKRYETSPAELGLKAYKITDRRYGLQLLPDAELAMRQTEAIVPTAAPDPATPPAGGNEDDLSTAEIVAVQPQDFEAWATDVDELLQRESEEPATEEQLHAMYDEGLQPRDAQQRIIEERANALISAHHEIEPDEVKPAPTPASPPQPVVAQTLADQAQAPHKDSTPTPAVTLVHLQLPQSFTLEEAAPIAHRIVRKAGVELVAVDASTRQAIRTFSRADAANA